MKIAYLTRISVPSKTAQSVQIHSMCRAFEKHLQNDFCLITPKTEENIKIDDFFCWIKIKLQRRILFYFHFACLSLIMARKWGADAIFTRDIGVAFLSALCRFPTVYEVHKEPRTFFAKATFLFVSMLSGIRFVSISHALSEYYQIKQGISDNRIMVAHDGVFIEKYDSLRSLDKNDIRKFLGLPQDIKIIMHTGSLYPGRGAELFGILLESFPDILFVQVGGLPDDVNKWQNQYNKFKNIFFVPHVENNKLVMYQMCSDLLFFPMTKNNPIWWCTSPMKLFEYMASGIPILGSTIGSSGEILNNNNCIMFNPDNSDSIISGVEYYLSHDKESKIKATQAMHEVRQYYTWELRATRIIEFLAQSIK